MLRSLIFALVAWLALSDSALAVDTPIGCQGANCDIFFSNAGTERMRIHGSTGTVTIPGLLSGIVHSDGSGNFTSSAIVNADVSSGAAITYSKLSLGLSITDSDISNSASINSSKLATIPYSKLNLSLSILNSDISSSAGIAYSKLSLTGQILDADISGSTSISSSKLATIPYSKLSLSNSIVNADINSAAAISSSKLATIPYSKLSLGNSVVGSDINTGTDVSINSLNLAGGGAFKIAISGGSSTTIGVAAITACPGTCLAVLGYFVGTVTAHSGPMALIGANAVSPPNGMYITGVGSTNSNLFQIVNTDGGQYNYKFIEIYQ